MSTVHKPKLNKSKSILMQIAEHKAVEVETRKTNRPLETFIDSLENINPALSFEAAISKKTGHPNLILEIKPASPSQGIMRPQLESELDGILKYYQQYGVGISVLADTSFFGGGLPLLKSVVQQTSCPVLCKEFILDPYQLYEAKESGASAALLIVKMVAPEALTLLYHKAKELGLTPVVEIQNEMELQTALTLNPSVLLINHRDLDTLELDMTTVERLAPKIPADILTIAASGISDRAMFERLHPYCDAYLVGSALMKKPLAEWEKTLSQWYQPFSEKTV